MPLPTRGSKIELPICIAKPGPTCLVPQVWVAPAVTIEYSSSVLAWGDLRRMIKFWKIPDSSASKEQDHQGLAWAVQAACDKSQRRRTPNPG